MNIPKIVDKVKTGRLMPRIILIVGLVTAFILGALTSGGANKRQAAGGEAGQEHNHEEEENTVWTCSMHPQIKMEEPGQCPICFMDLIPLSESGGDGGGDEGSARLSMSEHAKARANIHTAPAVRRAVHTDVQMVGKIAYDETRVEVISARIAGRLDRLFVDYTGVPVKRGDHLAMIYSPELVSAQRELLEATRAYYNLPQDVSPIVRRGAKQTLDAVKEKMRLLGFTNAEMRAIQNRGTTSDHMTIRAGQNGVVIEKTVNEGGYVQVGSPLFHIADLTQVWVQLDAYESDLIWLRLGQTVEFEVEAWPGEIFEGTVSFIDPIVNPSTRTVKLRVIAENKDGRLKPDMFVRAVVKSQVTDKGGVKSSALAGKWISPMHPQVVKDGPGTCDVCGMPLVPAEELGYVTGSQSETDPLIIPATAPLLTGKRALVYVEVPHAEQPTYEGREVTLGPKVGDSYVVKAGLAEGKQVVVNGAFRIDGELQIRAKPSMMSPEGGVAAGGHNHGERSDQDHSQHAQKPEEAGPPVSNKPMSADFEKQLKPVFETYYTLADALAADDPAAAREALGSLKKKAGAVKAPAGEQYKAWEQAHKKLSDALEASADTDDIEKLRAVFEDVSTQIIMLARHYGSATVSEDYVAYCPMAFDNKGAYWLQSDDMINNPYFGARMLRCGEIKETIE